MEDKQLEQKFKSLESLLLCLSSVAKHGMNKSWAVSPINDGHLTALKSIFGRHSDKKGFNAIHSDSLKVSIDQIAKDFFSKTREPFTGTLDKNDKPKRFQYVEGTCNDEAYLNRTWDAIKPIAMAYLDRPTVREGGVESSYYSIAQGAFERVDNMQVSPAPKA